MKLFVEYLRQQRRIIALYAAFCCIFVITFLLYSLPLNAVLYPAVLCAVLGAVALLARFFRVRGVCRVLGNIGSRAGVLSEVLPGAETAAELEYQRIIQLLAEEQAALSADQSRRYEDMMDYYTVWVHQIKTPIAAMRLVLQGEDSPLSRNLGRELLRIEQYVEMVLIFLRLESSCSDYVIREYDLDAVVRQSVKKFSTEFIGRRLELSYEPLNERVVTDEKWLSFVIEQVLSNALKYTPSGGIRIFMERPGVLCIRDTGMGIAPEDLPRIFEKGYTGYQGRVDKKASGIGLYLCRRICTKLGHTIEAESVPDEGTTLRIDMRRKPVNVE